ncbi:MAG: hypothetical protein IH856_12850 [Deltaproteobacteria bacterium]|nr:hypothetical protein [Deltaproteobacteria bacterium]
MNLRTNGLISTLTFGLLAGPLPAEAQRTGKVYRIGFLSAAGGHGQRFSKEGLVELGYYMEGQNIAIVNRFALHKSELLPKLVAELVNLKVDVIVSGTLTAARCGPPQVQSQCQHPGWKF